MQARDTCRWQMTGSKPGSSRITTKHKDVASCLPSLTSGTILCQCGDEQGSANANLHLTSSRRLQNYSLHPEHSHVMFSIHAARHCHSFTLLRRSLISSRAPAIRHASLNTLARPQSIVRHCQPEVRRYASTQDLIKAGATSRLNRSTFKTPSVDCKGTCLQYDSDLLPGSPQCLPRKRHPDRLCGNDANCYHCRLRPRSHHDRSTHVFRSRPVHVVGACRPHRERSPTRVDRLTLRALRFDHPSTRPTEC
jgi:hypothetical protein